MRVLLAVDKFKGTLTAAEVSAHLATPIARAGIKVESTPLADGGDGTVDAVISAGFTEQRSEVTGPLGQAITARWAVHGATAVVESAEASGLAVMIGRGRQPNVDTARNASSIGTGELIAAAVAAGARTVVLGVGGSATTDGGLGLLMGLGAVVCDADGRRIESPHGVLGRAAAVDLELARRRLDGVRLVVAGDVENPLTGKRGAAAVFGPQKGADDDLVAQLDAELENLAELLDPMGAVRDVPGAGAAGGMGFAALLLGAQLVSGADYILDLTGFDDALSRADAVITGEGRFDTQTLEGKGPAVVMERARTAGIPVFAVCGSADPDVSREALAGLFQLTERAPVEQAMSDPGTVLEAVGAEAARAITCRRRRSSCG